LLAVDFVNVDRSGTSNEEESAGFQSQPAAERATTAAEAGEDAPQFNPQPVPAEQGSERSGQESDDARTPEDGSSSANDSDGAGWSGLRVAEVVLGVGALLLATGWIISARRQRQ
jgi:hypothetical protein